MFSLTRKPTLSPLALKTKTIAITVAVSALLFGCGDSNNNTDDEATNTYEYQVDVKNLTNAQPLSPIALAFHDEGTLWQVGSMASDALELLAESGDNTDFLAQSELTYSQSGTGLIMPGMSESVTVTFEGEMPELLTLATMLVNTNDAFTGISAVDLTDLMEGESISLQTRSYDAGTEANSELASTVPGISGEGYNSERDDVDFVSMHAGVVSSDDGLTLSGLTEAHRFDNPTTMITISRVK